MTKLCETCPLANTACGEIIGLATEDAAETEITRVGHHIFRACFGKLGVLVDGAGNTSEVLQIPAQADIDEVLPKMEMAISSCEGPTTPTRFLERLFRKSPTCPALNELRPSQDFVTTEVVSAVEQGLVRRGKIMAYVRTLGLRNLI